MGKSKVAKHPARSVIERALALRTPGLRELGERFGLTSTCLCRHRQRMTPEEVADAILGTSGGLTRDELLALCQREHDHIPTSLAIRRQTLEHVSAEAMASGDWMTVAAIDTRLHAIDEFTHRLFVPVMNGLGAADTTPKVEKIERIIIEAVAPSHTDDAPPSQPPLMPEPAPSPIASDSAPVDPPGTEH